MRRSYIGFLLKGKPVGWVWKCLYFSQFRAILVNIYAELGIGLSSR